MKLQVSEHLVARVAKNAGLLLVALMLLSAIGCGDGKPERATVAGTVLIDGEPLPKGNITFVPSGGRPSVARIQPDGSFELRCFDEDDGAIIGTHQVAISAKDIISEDNIKWYAPAKYSDYRDSGLTVEVTEATDDLVIELTWDVETKKKRRQR